MFALEHGVRLYLAPRKGEFVRRNVIDLVVVLVPFLLPLRVLRSARALRLLRAARGTVVLFRAVDAGRDVLRRRRFSYTPLVALAVAGSWALLVLELERRAADPNIRSLVEDRELPRGPAQMAEGGAAGVPIRTMAGRTPSAGRPGTGEAEEEQRHVGSWERSGNRGG